MGSKALLFLGLFLAIFFMISSEVVARELAETSNSMNSNNITTDQIRRIPRLRPGAGRSMVCRLCDTWSQQPQSATTFISNRVRNNSNNGGKVEEGTTNGYVIVGRENLEMDPVVGFVNRREAAFGER
ncbi:hypothetical protein RND71_022406 [Anisodus tanguticus]|uniref:Uncharacterized protein n=1 Tax=Anisodus tanguticus TaxID=243964 RepID=A0AAE1RTK5_9SOLA|nr:hypothetical protein RND71_022406 [Anisodus tanguticus]